MAVTVITREIDWSLDFRDRRVLDGWCRCYDVGSLSDAPKVRQFIGAMSHVWVDGMVTILRQCQDLLRQRGCDRQARAIDGVEKSVFTVRDILKVLEDGGIGNGGHVPAESWSDDFLDQTYCTLSYGASKATLLCWSHGDVLNDMVRLCEGYGLDISIMPETRYGNVYDVVGQLR